MAESDALTPRNFFLNEQHELSRGEKEGAGRLPRYHNINWASKGHRISSSLEATRTTIATSQDPLRNEHYFLLAKPVQEIQKLSTNQRAAKDGIISEKVRYNHKDSRVFRRLGMDLVSVTRNGNAVVHARPERLEQLVTATSILEDAGAREQSRWASIDSFSVIPRTLRIDSSWLKALEDEHPTEAVVELQPLLSRAEVDLLLRSIAGRLNKKFREARTSVVSDK